MTVTVYGPLAPDATTNAADTLPLHIEHEELVNRPLGLEESVHVVSPEAKFEPMTRTFVPARPEDGVTATIAVTVKGTEIDPCWTSVALLIVTERNPPRAFAAIL